MPVFIKVTLKTMFKRKVECVISIVCWWILLWALNSEKTKWLSFELLGLILRGIHKELLKRSYCTRCANDICGVSLEVYNE